MKWLIIFLRIALAGIFLYAGLIKAGASEEFALALVPFTIVPPEWAGTFAVILAWTEILAGLLLLIPRVYPLGATMIFVLSGIFIAALTWALSQGIIVDCACFGRDEAPSAMKMIWAILRDVLIAAAALAVGVWALALRARSQ